MDLNLKKLLINCNYDDEPNYTHVTTYPEIRKWNVKTNKLYYFGKTMNIGSRKIKREVFL